MKACWTCCYVLIVITPMFAQVDTDQDGLPDEWEIKHYLNPDDKSDAWLDWDGDGVNNLFEYELKANPWDIKSPVGINVRPGDDLERIIDTLDKDAGYLIRLKEGVYAKGFSTNDYENTRIMIQGGWNSDFTKCDPYTYQTFIQADGSRVLGIEGKLSRGNSVLIIDGIRSQNGGMNMFLGRGYHDSFSQNRFYLHRCHFSGREESGLWTSAITLYANGIGKREFIFSKCVIAGGFNKGIHISGGNKDGLSLNVEIINCTIIGQKDYGLYILYRGEGTLSEQTLNIVNSICMFNDKEDIWHHSDSDKFKLNILNSAIGLIDANDISSISIDDPIEEPLNLSDDFTPQAGSTCIDRGVDVGLPFVGDAPDVGAIESGSSLTPMNPSTTLEVDLYPNPAISHFTLDINLPSQGKIEIYVVNTQGAIVANLLTGSLAAGKYQLPVRQLDLPNGLYVINVKTDMEQIPKYLLIAR